MILKLSALAQWDTMGYLEFSHSSGPGFSARVSGRTSALNPKHPQGPIPGMDVEDFARDDTSEC